MSVAEKLEEINGPARTGLTALYRGGLIPLRVLRDYETYQVYVALRGLPRFCDQPRQAVAQAAADCGVHLSTVYRVISAMTRPFAG